MEDIKLLEQCPKCGENLTLMSSIRAGRPDEEDELSGSEWLVKRCLKCGGYPCTEVVMVKPAPRTCENCTRWNQAYTAPNKDFHYCDNLEKFTRKSFCCSEHENNAELEDRLDADRFDNEYC